MLGSSLTFLSSSVGFFLSASLLLANADDSRCTAKGGTCTDYRYTKCTAGYERFLCDGDNNRRCCLPCDATCLKTSSRPMSGSTGSCSIVSRSQWGARSPTSSTPLATPGYVIVHHTVTGGCSSTSACASIVRGIQTHHMTGNGWSDIGYNFLIGGNGDIFEGRGWNRVGAHAPNYNSKSIGIAMIGTFTGSLPTASARDSLNKLIACGVSKGEISSTYRLLGHRQVKSTECPGQALYNYIKTLPHYSASP
ncbi:unnamed protein product [Cyprideis torosa]|uniref:Peptidoglycan-recognition protein n=1 Tax=Cyprideis torosa TaxID=163714 RepID=A0A7R8ZJM5_9CRUS|nr:unnamed protein product [Cyprideis torosa]CAG0889019.1 unnamed protein product [Cyprideis torosa]